MMRLLMLASLLATVLPMVALLAWVRPVVAEKWRRAGRGVRGLAILFWVTATIALMAFPHDDVFTGVDDMAYRKLSQVFFDGRGLHDRDTVLEKAPEAIRSHFLLQPGPLGRPTRDRLFQLGGWNSVETSPYFLPLLPLAAGGLTPILSPDRFLPLMGALWLALVLAAGFCAGGGWGVLACAALALGTAWPAWFLRGFHSEGLATLLMTAVVAASTIRFPEGRSMLTAGLTLGLSVSCHPTLSLLALPIGLGLAVQQGRWRQTVRLAVGLALGALPLLAITRWVCRPYGDFLSWQELLWLVSVSPEHRAVATTLVAVAVVGSGLLAVCHSARVRRWLGSGWRWWGLTVGLATVCAATWAMPFLAEGTLLKGWLTTWSGIGWAYAGLVATSAVFLFSLRRRMRERFGFAALCAVAVFFVYLKGLEVPVGVWSNRRFLPIVLAGVAMLTAPLAAGLAACMTWRRWAGWGLALLVVTAGAWNIARWPVAYFTVNEHGAKAWTRTIEDRIGTNRWVVFDYYADSVPYAADLQRHVLGLSASSRDHWPEVADWLTHLAKQEEVWLVTSWSPTALEDGAKLVPLFAVAGHFPTVRTKAFFPATRSERSVQNSFLHMVPLAPNERIAQDKLLDGSPFGLRGPWGRRRRGGTWTREGSGIVGPVPAPGGSVSVTLWAEFGQGPSQTLRVQPPWASPPLALEIPKVKGIVSGVLQLPQSSPESAPTGIYRFSAVSPYDPVSDGIRGYDTDLGAMLYRVRIDVIDAGVPAP